MNSDIDLRREAIISLGANIVILLAEFSVLFVLSRFLSVTGVGTYFFIVSIGRVVLLPIETFIAALRKRGSEEESELGAYLSLIGIAFLLYAPVIYGAGLVFDVGVIAPFLVVVTGLLFMSVCTKYVDALGYPGWSFWIQAAREVVLIISFVLVSVSVVSEALYLRGGVYIGISLFVFGGLRVLPRYPKRRHLGELWSFAKWKLGADVANRVRRESPVILIEFFIGSAAVSLYEAANRISSIGSYSVTCFTDPLHIKISSSEIQLNAEQEAAVTNTFFYVPLIPLFIFLIAVGFGDSLATFLLNESLAQAGLLVMLMAIAKISYAYYDTLKMTLYGINLQHKVAKIAVFVSVMAILSHAVAAFFFGLVGVAFSLITITMLQTVLFGYVLNRECGYVFRRWLINPIVLTSLFSLPLFFFKGLLLKSSVLVVYAICIVFWIGYHESLYTSNDIDES